MDVSRLKHSAFLARPASRGTCAGRVAARIRESPEKIFAGPLRRAAPPGQRVEPAGTRISNLKHFRHRAGTGHPGESPKPLLHLDFFKAGLLFATWSARQSTT